MAYFLRVLPALLAAAVMAALVLVGAYGSTEQRGSLTRKETAAYVKLALKYSRYTEVRGLPIVEIVPQKVLQIEVCGGEPCPIAGLFNPLHPERVLVAIEQSPGELKRTIVHETVHWIQFHTGSLQNRESCAEANAREAEAYAAAFTYVVKELGYTGAFWYPVAPCPSDVKQ